MNAIDNTDAELEAFDTACRRLGGFDDRVSAEWADGYLTALAAGPRAVPVDEWLPRLAGDAFERAFADPEDAAWARRSLTARSAVLARQLDAEALIDHPDALRLQPLLALWDDAARAALVEEQGVAAAEAAAQHTGALWAAGFLDALDDFVADRQSAADVDDEDAGLYDELLGHVQVLLLDDGDADFKAHVERYWKDRLATREDLLDEACFAIQDLRVWWTDHAPRPPPRQVEARPGRNDPCPCGSGRKFKRCHGQPA